MRAPLPARSWRTVVYAAQGIVLMVADADLLPLLLTRVALAAALARLAESFGRDVWWLWSHRQESRSAAPAARAAASRRGRTGIAVLFTILSLLLVWGALVAPDQENRLTPSALG